MANTIDRKTGGGTLGFLYHDSEWGLITTYVNATVTEKGRIAKRLRIDIIKDMVIVEKIPPTLAPIAV